LRDLLGLPGIPHRIERVLYDSALRSWEIGGGPSIAKTIQYGAHQSEQDFFGQGLPSRQQFFLCPVSIRSRVTIYFALRRLPGEAMSLRSFGAPRMKDGVMGITKQHCQKVDETVGIVKGKHKAISST
jgi:hypothetical protein